MKKEIAAMWVAALRSGEYKQGTGFLHDTLANTYCCLGVLCDLSIKQGLKLDLDSYTIHQQKTTTLFNNCDALLPSDVRRWAGMSCDRGTYDTPQNSLSELNDSGMPFTQIANITEKEWESL